MAHVVAEIMREKPGRTVFAVLAMLNMMVHIEKDLVLQLCHEAIDAGVGVDDKEVVSAECWDETPLQMLAYRAVVGVLTERQWILLDFLLTHGADRTLPSRDGDSLLDFVLRCAQKRTGIDWLDERNSNQGMRFAQALMTVGLQEDEDGAAAVLVIDKAE
jgi:hypothetical protein